MSLRERRRIDFKLRVHTVPADLRMPLPQGRRLTEYAAAYRIAVESRLLWDVWMIDRYEALWIAVSFENDRGEAEFHTLRIDPDAYRKVSCDPYETDVEVG
jgi:hypothetical protein